MSGLEQAIRHALERADRANPDIRSRIYQSARNALDAGLRKQSIEDPAIFERQHSRLEATIREVEDEELARLRAIATFERVALEREPEDLPAPEAPQPVVQRAEPALPDDLFATAAPDEPARPVEPVRPVSQTVPVAETAAWAVEPAQEEARAHSAVIDDEPEVIDDRGSLDSLIATRDDRAEARPGTAAPLTAESNAKPTVMIAERPVRRRRGASLLTSLFVYCCLLGILGGAGWWVYSTGMVDALMKGEGNFDLVPAALTDETAVIVPTVQLDTLRGFSGEWTDVYKPGDSADQVTARLKAEIAQSRDSDGLATTIASGAPDQNGDVLVPVPASILQRLAGKTSTLAVTVKSDSDKPAHIYIQCEVSTLGDCGRHRYTVTNERADELIRMNFDGKLGPSEPGFIIINSDVKGDGGRIRLYGIRVLEGS